MAVTGNKPRRKSKSAVVYIPTAVILILFLMAFGVSVFLKIINIEVIGASVYTKEEIITASGITKGDNMLLYQWKQRSEQDILRFAVHQRSQYQI